MTIRRLFIVALGFMSAWALLWLIFANPFNFFVPRSERFSMAQFRMFVPGSSISEAISVLGQPVAIVKRERPGSHCPSCVSYCFMGEPPDWVISFKEAWLVADQSGRVVRVFVNTEP